MTERLARACAAHPWRVVGLWSAAVAAGIVMVALFLGGNLTAEQEMLNDPESYRGARLARERLPDPRPVDDVVIVRSESLEADDPSSSRSRALCGAACCRRASSARTSRPVSPRTGTQR